MKFLIEIVNMRSGESYDFRCDRTTPLGNCFHMSNEGKRDSVCNAYAEHVKTVGFDKVQLAYLRKIWAFGARKGSVKLACWCAPKRCHVETIKAWLEEKMI